MDVLGWLAVLGTALVVVAFLVSFVVLFRVVAVLGQAVDSLTVQVGELRDHTLPALAEARKALRSVEGQAAKADALLDVATSLTSTADNASRLAHRLVSNPFIKAAAFMSGTRRAAAKLRSRN